MREYGGEIVANVKEKVMLNIMVQNKDEIYAG
jgi:hypothetical protein